MFQFAGQPMPSQIGGTQIFVDASMADGNNIAASTEASNTPQVNSPPGLQPTASESPGQTRPKLTQQCVSPIPPMVWSSFWWEGGGLWRFQRFIVFIACFLTCEVFIICWHYQNITNVIKTSYFKIPMFKDSLHSNFDMTSFDAILILSKYYHFLSKLVTSKFQVSRVHCIRILT